MALKGLIIDEPWIGMILRGEKSWEMRSRGTSIRGQIALIEKGTGTIVGLAMLTDSPPPLNPAQMALHSPKHRIPPEKIAEPGFKWFTPWILAGVRPLTRPVRYKHPSGAVTWVNLSAQEEAAVVRSNDRQGHFSDVTTGAPAPPTRSATCEERLLADRVVSQISHDADLSIPADASRTIRRRGNKLYIDVEWDGGLPPARHRKSSALRDLIGVFGVAASAFCCLALTIHLPLAILVSGVTILGALKWVPAMFISMLVAVIGGHGDDLNEIFGSR
jgi:hypothetical protein